MTGLDRFRKTTNGASIAAVFQFAMLRLTVRILGCSPFRPKAKLRTRELGSFCCVFRYLNSLANCAFYYRMQHILLLNAQSESNLK